MRQTCPICKKKDVVEASRPFCSKRCADVDLGRWLKGGYAIPTDEHVPESEMPPTPANDSDVY